jgi:exo-1,4-beta-D-glucosaminidase
VEKSTRRAFIESGSASLLALSLLATSRKAPRPHHSVGYSEIDLDGPWHIQSASAAIHDGAHLSSTAYDPPDWYRTAVPSTVFAALLENGVYRDPFYGMNMRTIPGANYPVGAVFSNLQMPPDSPFRESWWYRTTFDVPREMHGRYAALHVDGVNYRANLWVNGKRIAASDELAGMWRAFEFDVTEFVQPGKNAIAIEVFAPGPDDLALTFVDWNPMPPDKDMGLFRGVRLSWSGPVTLRNPQVVSRIEVERDRAHLTLYADVRNAARTAVDGVVRARLLNTHIEQRVRLAPGQRKTVLFEPERFAQLTLASPPLWWPAHMGEQPLHDLAIEFEIDGAISDRANTRFGMREVTSEIDERGHRLFKINGKRMLVLGAGYTPDMALRADPQRQEDEVRYVRDMHLNTVRLEGKIENDHFFELCDRYGIMVMAGWCCCDRWESWEHWNAQNYRIAPESLRTQLRRLRNHPSILTWSYGSDNAPPPRVERLYLDVLREERWPNPYQAAASARTTLIGTTGVKMTGPYDYVAPSYWLDPRAPGGAAGFNSETSPGAAVPPLESLRRFIPADHLWPIDEYWNYHAGGGQFKNIHTFTHALEARYGKALSVEDYALKAQLMTYEGERAMFEAFRRNKYVSTGVIQWMLNNAWPSLIWHLYDYYLRPGGGYFGTKKACEPLHVQYSYDDRSVVVANELHRAFPGYSVRARVFDTQMRSLFEHRAQIDVQPDSAARLFTIPQVDAPLHFVHLALADAHGRELTSNVYWLSAKSDVFDWSKSTWYFTPLTEYADFSELSSLARVELSVRARTQKHGARCATSVTLRNASETAAFFVRAALRDGKGEEVLPVLWSDNYVTVLPGEQAVLEASYRAADMRGGLPSIALSGWNVPQSEHSAPI